ncbi:MAG: hypothetical protein E3J72_03415 [Planctomycetota bacterium]|nr:MAG: hypothetical protein E3J72_03415 [Planctomycetota bacterium]
MIRHKGEVSTRLIIVLTIVGVLVVAAVPLGFYIYTPLTKLFKNPERFKLAWEETFEGGKFSESWTTWGNVKITKDAARSGDWGYHGFGSLTHYGSCGLTRQFEIKPPFRVEVDMKNGDEPFGMGGLDGRGCIYVWETGRRDHGLDIFQFGDEKVLRFCGKLYKKHKWVPDKWYRISVLCEKVGGKFRVTPTVNGKKLPPTAIPLRRWMKDWKNGNLAIVSSSGTCLIDNIRVYRVVEDD